MWNNNKTLIGKVRRDTLLKFYKMMAVACGLYDSETWTLTGKVKRDILLKFYELMAVPCGLYGNETWTLIGKTQSRIQASEMRFLRSVLGALHRDRLSNDDIRNMLEMCTLNKMIKQYRQDWIDPFERMHKNRIPNKFLFIIQKDDGILEDERTAARTKECATHRKVHSLKKRKRKKCYNYGQGSLLDTFFSNLAMSPCNSGIAQGSLFLVFTNYYLQRNEQLKKIVRLCEWGI